MVSKKVPWISDVWKMTYFQIAFFLTLISGTLSSNPGPFTRVIGEKVIFMFNTSTNISEVLWGIRDGDTNNIKYGPMIFVDSSVTKLNQNLPSSYVGRVSFVGDLAKGQAWFKIINLNISDTNQYMAKIKVQGASGYSNIPVNLTVIVPAFTTSSSSTPASMTTQDSTNIKPTSPPTLKNLSTKLEVNETFKDGMQENSSPIFKNFSKRFTDAIKLAYKEEPFERATVTKLRKGSILVDFVLYFTTEISPDKACAPLENAIRDNKLGSFNIIPGSLGCSKKPTTSPSITTRSSSASTDLHPGIIAGVVIVGILAVIGLVIAIFFVCRKKSSEKDYRSSTNPQEIPMQMNPVDQEQQYAAVKRPVASSLPREDDRQLQQYALVDKSKKAKKRDPNELVYAELDHGNNRGIDVRPSSDRRPNDGSDTVYADIQSRQHRPPQYGNLQAMEAM